MDDLILFRAPADVKKPEDESQGGSVNGAISQQQQQQQQQQGKTEGK